MFSSIPKFPVSSSPIGPTNIKKIPGMNRMKNGEKIYYETTLNRIDPAPWLIGLIVAMLTVSYFSYTTPEINDAYSLLSFVAIGLSLITVAELKDREDIPSRQQPILKINNNGGIKNDKDWNELARRQKEALDALTPAQQAQLSQSLSFIQASPTTISQKNGRGAFYVLGPDGKSMQAVNGTISQMPGLVQVPSRA